MAVPKVVQSRSSNATSSAATLALAYSSNLVAAHLLVAACIWGSNTQTCTVASSANGSWTAIGSPQRGTGGLAAYTIQLFYKLNSAAGADTVTMTCSGSNTYRDMAIHEYSGVDITSALEASTYSGNVTAVGSVITTASGITTTNGVDLLFCAAMVDNACSGAGAGYTLDELVNFGSNCTEHMDHYSTGTYSATVAVTSVTNASMVLVAFKQTAPTLGSNNNSIVQSYNGGTGVHTASAGTVLDLTTWEEVEIDTLCIRPTAIAYLEIVAKTSVSLANTVTLYGGQGGVVATMAGIDIPTGTTSYTYFRSAPFSMPVGDKLDYGIIIGAGTGGTTSVAAWRVNILQGSGSEVIRTTETQIEIGNYESGTNTTAAPLAKPKYWTYTAANWDGLSQYFVSLKVGGTGGTVTVLLQQDDGAWGSWTTFSTVYSAVLNGTTWPIAAMPVPTTGRHYRLAISTSSGTWTVYNCKILVDQFEGGTLFDGGTGFYNSPFPVLGGTATSANQAQAESFKITNACTLTGCRVTMKKVGSPVDNLTFTLVSSLGGTALATGTFSAASATASWASYDITFGAGYSPTLNTQYYLQVVRSGSVDASNYVALCGDTTFNDQIGQGYTRTNNAWSAINYDIIMQLLGAAGLKKIEMPFQLLNTGNIGTGLQSMKMKYVASEWAGWTSTPYYQHDSNNAANSSKLTIPPSTDITGATVTGANEQLSASFSWPSDGSLIDANVTNSTGIIAGSRVVVLAQLSSGTNVTITATAASAKPSGANAAVSTSITVAAGVGSAKPSGTNAKVITSITVNANAGSAKPSGASAAVVTSQTINASSGSAMPTGANAIVVATTSGVSATVNATAGSGDVSGVNAAAATSQVINANVGSANPSGVSSSVSDSQAITAAAGSAGVDGASASISASTTINAAAGSAQARGTNSIISSSVTISAGPGSSTASGISSTVTVSSGLSITVTATSGCAEANGASAQVSTSVAISGAPAISSITGITAKSSIDVTVSASPAIVNPAGVSARLSASASIGAGPGAAALFGPSAKILLGSLIPDGLTLAETQAWSTQLAETLTWQLTLAENHPWAVQLIESQLWQLILSEAING